MDKQPFIKISWVEARTLYRKNISIYHSHNKIDFYKLPLAEDRPYSHSNFSFHNAMGEVRKNLQTKNLTYYKLNNENNTTQIV